MIYKIVNLSNQHRKVEYKIVPYLERFVVPDKIYGTVLDKVKYIWNEFAKSGGRASVLFTGIAGNSKSLAAKLLCNAAVDTYTQSQVPIDVYVISEQEGTQELISLISGLNNCIIFIDEFGKLFYRYQDLFLSLLSDNNKKRLFLLTENRKSMINSYILNRPERIRYHIEFNRLENEVIVEYCKDHNVPESFVKELLRINMVQQQFCFDHLCTLVTEAKSSNRWDIEWLINILNLKILTYNVKYRPLKVTDNDNSDVSLILDTSLVTDGITTIKVIDSVVFKSFSNDPNKDTFDNMDTNISTTNISNNISKIEDPIIDSKIELCNKIKEVYENVDPETDRNEFRGYNRDRGSSSLLWIKVNINPENLLDIKDNVYVYSDVTGKFKVYFQYSKQIF